VAFFLTIGEWRFPVTNFELMKELMKYPAEAEVFVNAGGDEHMSVEWISSARRNGLDTPVVYVAL
jgi:hypothetical protein